MTATQQHWPLQARHRGQYRQAHKIAPVGNRQIDTMVEQANPCCNQSTSRCLLQQHHKPMLAATKPRADACCNKTTNRCLLQQQQKPMLAATTPQADACCNNNKSRCLLQQHHRQVNCGSVRLLVDQKHEPHTPGMAHALLCMLSDLR